MWLNVCGVFLARNLPTCVNSREARWSKHSLTRSSVQGLLAGWLKKRSLFLLVSLSDLYPCLKCSPRYGACTTIIFLVQSHAEPGQPVRTCAMPSHCVLIRNTDCCVAHHQISIVEEAYCFSAPNHFSSHDSGMKSIKPFWVRTATTLAYDVEGAHCL